MGDPTNRVSLTLLVQLHAPVVASEPAITRGVGWDGAHTGGGVEGGAPRPGEGEVCFFFAPSPAQTKKKKQAGASATPPLRPHKDTACPRNDRRAGRHASAHKPRADRIIAVNRPLRKPERRTDARASPLRVIFRARSTRLSSNKRPRDGRESGELPRELAAIG
jgi:hypothetical protein